ncbi:hypothetical protein [Streptomyces shenzhenensis]|uniref:DNA primase n=1 Tax=Streptomyces shenzhenensis TaxID=943815 RepID=A0A3M0HWK9_9ACTN|nr:hypothetical protein [Streptomyces shenzhenensis]RMB80102.1 hypothetical protein CTZ28_41870 [Streptomyces shenzhenensis]
MEPVNTRNPTAAARAYLALEWPLTVGHRYRPKQGCTCGRTTCPIPGAHPVPHGSSLDESSLTAALESAPGAGLIAHTERFDAVIVPRQVGMAAMALLDRDTPIPCLIAAPDTYVLLVLPATGRYAAVNASVEVRTGQDGWIALPPSRGARWDNPPWIEGTTEPRKLINGDEIRCTLSRCFAVIQTGSQR